MSRDELLTLLIEECAEVIQAATKIQRFGWDRHQPYYGENREVLAHEIGDVLGVIDGLGEELPQDIVILARLNKLAKAERVKAEILG